MFGDGGWEELPIHITSDVLGSPASKEWAGLSNSHHVRHLWTVEGAGRASLN